jgi:hypothetical protein
MDEFTMVTGPVHEDLCNHCPNSYVASFKYMDGQSETTVDFYCFGESDSITAKRVCLRYDGVNGAYNSPGSVNYMLHACKTTLLYRIAACCLLAKGLLSEDQMEEYI